MRNRSRIVGQFLGLPALAAAGIAVGFGGAALAQGSASMNAGTKITISVTDLRSGDGVVRACMTTNPKKFPKCRGDADAHSVVVPAGETVTLSFKGVKPGRYAIALLHDENNNGKADRALMMMPTEGFGFSRDAKVSMGPPKFKSAAFDVGTAPVSQTIKMRYML